jgi:hypothetical protein
MHAGDPIEYHYFRHEDILFRGGVVVSEDDYIARLERRTNEVWEPVPGSISTHHTDKSALKRMRQLLKPLEYTGLICMASFKPPQPEPEKESRGEIHIRHGDEPASFHHIGDYVVERKGGLYSVGVWDGLGVAEIGPCAWSLEAACLLAVRHMKKNAPLA